MPEFERGDVTIHYEVRGDGFPLLTLAPGGLNSAIDAWPRAAIDPLVRYEGDFLLVAMDQRNTGASRGPLDAEDPWGSYATDQLALIDHLGIERFHVMGCCIGCSYALQLIERAPERVVSAVLEQPIGLVPQNHEGWVTRRTDWADGLMAGRDDIEPSTAKRFGEVMFDRDFVGAVSREFVATITTPLLVLPGVDEIHPRETGLEVAELAPGAQLLDPWKDPDHLESATLEIRDWLVERTPS